MFQHLSTFIVMKVVKLNIKLHWLSSFTKPGGFQRIRVPPLRLSLENESFWTHRQLTTETIYPVVAVSGDNKRIKKYFSV